MPTFENKIRGNDDCVVQLPKRVAASEERAIRATPYPAIATRPPGLYDSENSNAG
jgi:hypothetical protein